MPHIPVHPSAQKRHRQNLKRQERNRAIKSHVRNAVKVASDAIKSSDATAAGEKLREATRALQRATSKGALHKNTARRQIARLSSQLHKAQSKSAK
ncbi:MAG: 30S ribosomal protein S20 [Candidatus Binataceae bacterium]